VIRKDLQEAEAPTPAGPGGEAGGGGGGGEAVSGVVGGRWGICDDNPVEAGGAAARLPDPIPAQVRSPSHSVLSKNPTGNPA
jgi:hypothetical protein